MLLLKNHMIKKTTNCVSFSVYYSVSFSEYHGAVFLLYMVKVYGDAVAAV